MKNEKGLIQFVVIAILTLGTIAGVWLVTAGPLKFFPRAVSAPISPPTPTASPISASVTPSPSLKPDLTVDRVEFLGSPIVGTNADFDIKVRNIGQTIASHPNSILVNVVIRKPNDVVLGSCTWAFNDLAAGAATTAKRVKDCPKYNINGQHKIIVEVDPHTEGVLGLDRVDESNEANNTKEILVDVTKTSVSGPISSPGPIKRIIQFRYAENPNDLQTASWQAYSPGIQVAHTFTDTSAGLKFIFIQFRDNKGDIVQIGGTDYILSSIELVSPSVSGPIPPPTCTDSDGGRNYEVAGKTTYTNNPDGILEEYDNCTSENRLAERVCNSQTDYTQNTESYTCPYGCENGACKRAPVASGGGGGGGGGGGSRPTPSPQRVIKEFRYAEDPNVVETLSWQPYTPGMVVSHTFSDPSPGVKFIFIQFRNNNGDLVLINEQRYISSSIELVERTPSPTPIATTIPTPRVTPIPEPVETGGSNCPISNPQSVDIGTLRRLCTLQQLARFDLKYLNDFDNQTLIDIGRATGDLGGFLANFTGERLIGAPPYSGSGFSLEILNELPAWRKQQLPGYIQDQLK